MGCGKSKHAVATANSTIIRNRNNDVVNSVNGKGQDGKRNDNIEVKDIADDKELKGDMNVEDEEPGREISKESPNRYFSSRKDEDVIVEGIASDKSEFFSPRLGPGKESPFNVFVESDDAVSGETLVQETENGEAVIVKQEVVAKEASVEPEAPTSDGEKEHKAKEEKLAVLPS